MAFHVACPLTGSPSPSPSLSPSLPCLTVDQIPISLSSYFCSQRICFCTLGFPEPLRSEDGRREFVEDVRKLEEFIRDPWFLRAGGRHTVQVLVPRVDAGVARSEQDSVENAVGGQSREEAPSLQVKRALMQRQAAEASLAAENHAKRLESGEITDALSDDIRDQGGEDHNHNIIKVICRLCFSAESEGSVRAARMISCKTCNKKYHRNCLKGWAQHRDLFDWSSWVCSACRICEVCRKVGDPTKFMFCKRCDGAYHSYCQHHPHKNVASGPYLCPNHTKCHSCGSTVPGNGSSTRWFLSYTCCDACGRLFTKEKYCPVCLKVYRDSESTPMVCCDVCQRWVHSQCDGISDDKYRQYQADSKLYYECAACRGGCYKVQDLDDAVRELWRRKDSIDSALIASLRAEVGLTEGCVSVSPYSDDEECHVDATITKNDGKSVKFSLKGLSNSKENGKEHSKNLKPYKKYTKKKDMQTNANGGLNINEISEPLTGMSSLEKDKEFQNVLESSAEKAQRMRIFLPPGPAGDKQSHPDQLDAACRSPFEEKPAKCENQDPKAIQIKCAKSQGLANEETNQNLAVKTEVTKGKRKLVIHFGSRNKKQNDTSKLETSSSQREHNSAASMGSKETNEQVWNAKEINPPEFPMKKIGSDSKKGARFDASSIKDFMHRSKSDRLFKDKANAEKVGASNHTVGVITTTDQDERNFLARFAYGERNGVENKNMAGSEATLMDELFLLRKQGEEDVGGNNENVVSAPVTSSKPSLKLKIKTASVGNHSSWISQAALENNFLKGKRSTRKRPSHIAGKKIEMEYQSNVDDEKNFLKGQRSKRKRPSQVVEKKLEMEDQSNNELMSQNLPSDQETDARILKKLGKDAIGKRVEVHQASDNSWHRGVVTGTMQGRSLSVSLDNGKSMALEFGKQRIRFVSQKAKLSKE